VSVYKLDLMARPGFAVLRSLVAVGLLASGCYTFRSSGTDSTVWDELPNDPRPELWAQGVPKLAVVFEGTYSGPSGGEPLLDERSTEFYQRTLRESKIFSQVMDGASPPSEGLPRVRMRRLFEELDHTGANFTKAATVPGLLGYRFGLVATLTLEIRPPEGDPVVYEAKSALTRIYHHSGRRDAARMLLYREADHANTQAILHQLRADPDLFEPLGPPGEPPR
jgi:hypothetical protein